MELIFVGFCLGIPLAITLLVVVGYAIKDALKRCDKEQDATGAACRSASLSA